MLGHDNTRAEQLAAENRVLREELTAARDANEALRSILRTQRAENDALVQQVAAMAERQQAMRRAMQRDARQVDGETVTAAGAMMRLCWN